MQGPFAGLLRPYRSISITGMCKNAGKTSVLNRIIADSQEENHILGLTSIGRDGEDTDLVTGTGKPGIWVRKGTLLATAAQLLRHCDITREVVDTTGITTPLGEVVILRALSDGAVQLAGPSMVTQLKKAAAQLLQHGADKVIIDGALSRKSLSTRSLSEATVLCSGASCAGSLAEVLRETAYAAHLALLPEETAPNVLAAAETLGAHKQLLVGDEVLPAAGTPLAALRKHEGNHTTHLLLDGALTDGMVKPLVAATLPVQGLTIVVHDASKLLLGEAEFERLKAKKIALKVLESVNLVAVTVNPFSAYGNHLDKDELREKMAQLVPVPVIDVYDFL